MSNKYAPLFLLLLLGACASTNYQVKTVETSKISACAESAKVLQEIGVSDESLDYLKQYGDIQYAYLRLSENKSSYSQSATFLPRATSVYQKIKDSAKSYFKGEEVQNLERDITHFLGSYIGVCKQPKVGAYEKDGANFYILDIKTFKPGNYSEEKVTMMSNISASNYHANKEELEKNYDGAVEKHVAKIATISSSVHIQNMADFVEIYNKNADTAKNNDAQLDRILNERVPFTYPSFEGMSKIGAAKKRKEYLSEKLRAVMYIVANISSTHSVTTYLQENTPLPPGNFEKVRDSYQTLRHSIDEVDPMLIHSPNPDVNNFLDEISAAAATNESFGWDKASTIDGESSYDYQLNKLVTSFEQRKKLFSLYLLHATKIEMSRSQDKTQVIFDVQVDIPSIFKEFKFDKLAKHIE